MRNIPNDVTIISGDNEEIQSNKYTLSIFSSTLRTLLSTSSTILFPECSTFSIKYLLDMITHGFVVTEKISHEEIIEITEAAQLLSIKMGELYHDKIVPSSVRTNKVDTRPKFKKQDIGESETSNDGNSESIIDVMDSLIRIFDPDYEPDEDVNMGENFGILNQPQMAAQQAKKRKRTDMSRNDKGKYQYQCQQCNYAAGYSSHLKDHVEAIHEGVRYPCNQCTYKATEKGNLQAEQSE